MIYPAELEVKLGFDQLRQKITNYCFSPAAVARIDSIQFTNDIERLSILLRQNLEFKQILEKAEDFPSRHYHDPTEWLKKIRLEGSFLDEHEFLDMANAMQTIVASKRFLTQAKETYPTLFILTEPLHITSVHVDMIRSKIDDSAFVKDGASQELNSVRKKLKTEQQRLRRLADQLFRNAVENSWVPEGALPTIRDGRVVIPVLAEHKRKLKGFILDESATGQTIFIEPAEMLDTNNEIRDLEHAEKREVIRILKAMTGAMREHLPDLESAFDFMAAIDLIRAKAKLSVEINADLPIVEDRPQLVWYRAVHPLLYLSLKGKRDVVPLEIELNDQEKMLLVSGPNAGGKSVCLKTVGLLQYMLQCGLLIPVSDRSRVGIFSDIFLDIGDQQSIENDLSTYSSHLRNMGVFIKSASKRSLILMDELGSGTDPNFGGAIAQAVMEALLEKQSWGVITTHYYNLKLYAGQHPGIRNAAMRFDDKKLMPLYILDIGKPGSSFALEIARKTGLPQQTLHAAEKLVGKDLAGFEMLIRNLERERNELAAKLQRLERDEATLKQSLSKYESLSSELELRKKEIIEKAKDEASQLLKNTNREIEKTIRHIRENKAEKKETLKVRKNLKDLSQRVGKGVDEKNKIIAEPLSEGDRVRIIGQEGSGIVISVKGKKATLQLGSLKSTIDVNRLEKVSGGMPKDVATKIRATGINLYEKQSRFNNSLDVRGKRVDEVIPLLDEFLDTAILLGAGELRILHGKGEGVLRKVIRDHLKKFKAVASFSDEHVERGGDGITIVVMK